jgi:hypothetical protein
MVRITCLVALLHFATVLVALADTYASYHSRFAVAFRSGLQQFAATNQRALPTNLVQLAPFLNWEGLEAISKRPVAERFLLLDGPPIEYPPGSGGRLLIVSQYPIEDGRYTNGFIRHIVWREAKGNFRHGKADEVDLQPLFEAAGTALPQGPLWVEQISPERTAKARSEQQPDVGTSPTPDGRIARRVTEVQGQEPGAGATSAVPEESAAQGRAGGSRGGVPFGWVAGGGLAAALGLVVAWFLRHRRRGG